MSTSVTAGGSRTTVCCEHFMPTVNTRLSRTSCDLISIIQDFRLAPSPADGTDVRLCSELDQEIRNLQNELSCSCRVFLLLFNLVLEYCHCIVNAKTTAAQKTQSPSKVVDLGRMKMTD